MINNKKSLILSFILGFFVAAGLEAAIIAIGGSWLLGSGKLDGWITQETAIPVYTYTSGQNSEAGQSEFYKMTSSETFIQYPQQTIYTYTGITNYLNCYKEANNTSRVLFRLSSGAQVAVIGEDSGYYLIDADGSYAFADKNEFMEGKAYATLDGAVDLRGYLPDAEFDLLFASDRNITGAALYPAIPMMQEDTARKLKEACEKFEADGYILKVYDAYRPKSAQFALWNIVQDSKFIANPNVWGSWHNLGRAIDMSLIDAATGEELEMPTPMHTFNDSAARYSSGQWTETAKNNVDYMTEVMTSVGFQTIETEWWHFEYHGVSGETSMVSNLNYNSLIYENEQDINYN